MTAQVNTSTTSQLLERYIVADVPSYSLNDEGQRIPKVWFYNGRNEAQRAPGFFFTTSKELATAPGKPWAESQLYRKPGGETTWQALGLTVTPIFVRSQAFIEHRAGDKVTREYLAKWTAGAKILTEILCKVDGIDDVVVWPSKGMIGIAVGKTFKHYRDKVLRPLEAQLKAEALKQGAPKDMVPGVPLWAFRLPIATALSPIDGRPLYEVNRMGGQSVTVPDFRLPVTVDGKKIYASLVDPRTAPLITAENLAAAGFALDIDQLHRLAELAEEYADWPKQRRNVEQADGDAEASTPTAIVGTTPTAAQTAQALRDIAARGHAALVDDNGAPEMPF